MSSSPSDPPPSECPDDGGEDEPASIALFPRRKAGEPRKRKDQPRVSLKITRSDLESRFHLPLPVAAKELGVCTTSAKKLCRNLGIGKWPYCAWKDKVRDGEPARQSEHPAHAQHDPFATQLPAHIPAALQAALGPHSMMGGPLSGLDVAALLSHAQAARAPAFPPMFSPHGFTGLPPRPGGVGFGMGGYGVGGYGPLLSEYQYAMQQQQQANLAQLLSHSLPPTVFPQAAQHGGPPPQWLPLGAGWPPTAAYTPGAQPQHAHAQQRRRPDSASQPVSQPDLEASAPSVGDLGNLVRGVNAALHGVQFPEPPPAP